MAEQFQEGASLALPNHEWYSQNDQLERSSYQSSYVVARREDKNRIRRYFVFVFCIIAFCIIAIAVVASSISSNHIGAVDKQSQENFDIHQTHQRQDKGDDSWTQGEEKQSELQQADSSQEQKQDIDNEDLNLWDLTFSQKQKLLQQYDQYISWISSKKTASSNQAYMNILSTKDKQIEADLKLFQKQAQVIQWSKSQLSESEQKQYQENYNKLLKEKQAHIEKLLQQYKDYKSSEELLSPIKNITKSQFYQAIKYHQLTGQKDLIKSLKQLSQEQKDMLQSKQQLSSFPKQLRACVIVPTFNNTHNNRFLWNIQSILLQEYDNFKVVIIDDASPDNTSQRISKHLRWRKADPNKFILIRSKQRNKSLFSFYYGAHKYCGPGEIIYTIDGDDELIGSQVFKTINAIYQKEKPYTLYSMFIIEHPNNNLTLGNNHQYSSQIKRKNSYRVDRSHGYGHLRTMLSDMFLYVDSSSFKDKSGKFYQLITDNAVYFCAMELSCERVRFVQEINYWYDYNTGNNIFKKMNIKNYRAVQFDVEAKKPYRCFHEYLKEASAWSKEKH